LALKAGRDDAIRFFENVADRFESGHRPEAHHSSGASSWFAFMSAAQHRIQ
jgi:hypothetical protein